MELPKTIQTRLAEEFRLVADKIQEEEDPFRKMYFFSAVYADISRALNWVWDKDLVLLHTVSQTAYERINSALQTIGSTGGRGRRIDSSIFKYLGDVVEDLASYFEEDRMDNLEKFCDLLRRFSELAYATTGNGSYLMEKGLIRL